MIPGLVQLVEDPRLVLGIAYVAGGMVRPASSNLQARAAEVAQRLLQPGWELPEESRKAVRSLLKTAGYSPTGRGKPAHEYLLSDLRERGSFRHISAPVDVNNVLSLELLLPISLLDADTLQGQLTVRIGSEGEGYVFNPSGQRIELKRCILLAGGPEPGIPLGSPVKDSMAGKVHAATQNFVGVIYGTRELYSQAALGEKTTEFAELLAAETGGRVLGVELN